MSASDARDRYAIDAPTLLRIVIEGVPIGEEVQLVAPASVRTHAVTTLLQRVQAGELSEREARELHTRMTELKIRVLSDRVSRWVAFQLAREHGWDSTADAEYLAVAKLQADALVTVDPQMAARAEGVVPLRPLEALSG